MKRKVLFPSLVALLSVGAAAAWATPDKVAECRGSAYTCKLPNPSPPKGKSCGGVNRLKNPLTGGCAFPLLGPAPLVDGLGGVIGTASSQGISINYGQRKLIRVNGVTASYVFALGVRLQEGDAAGSAYVVSGWLPLSSVAPQGNMPAAMPQVAAPTSPPGLLKRYTITGGSAKIRSQYAEFKVTPSAPLGPNSHQNVGDYLSRPTPSGQGVVNFLYSLPGSGGVATDTLPVGSAFVAASGITPQAVPMYDGHTRVAQKMTFVYGRVPDRLSGWRYGWIARWAITPVEGGK
ncbi:hypothetical protein FNU79_15420 [Deinococcus detaillensis]|uniref:SH3 domain-containing protein n=1 Tax=Deinococcus detaillensis TaxID=2592048 RepID=A0A553UMI3_9DEIO|nr:hypothetical protein [Deinococcus detaillensis]TSA81393.1 hypothetical protein FNU79_15420 [Deinococcus detaillensis]